MPDWILHSIPAVAAVVTLIWTIRKQNSAAAKMEGAAGQRLNSVEEDVDKLEQEQAQQWSKIGEHGERISRLEGPRRG